MAQLLLRRLRAGGSVSIDKPPVDLWLQVVSVKLLGFSSTTLKLPEALAGIASVPLLFAAVRRIWSIRAGLAAALALAVLPVEVITSRSDTMDAVMMALIILALLLLVRAVEAGSSAWLLAGAAALGLAFNVKLLESFVALPGLAVLAYLGLPGPHRRRLAQLAVAVAVYLLVAVSWLTATLLFPAHDRPYAIGSTDGSAWNAAFVFNGTDRLGSKSPEPQFTVYQAGHRYPVATQSERDHIPIVPPSPTRLLARIGPLSGERLGLELLVALLLGVPALLSVGFLAAPRRAARAGKQTSWGAVGEEGPSPTEDVRAPTHGGLAARSAEAEKAEIRRRVRRAAAAGLAVWMLTGIALFSVMSRLHPRYVEGFTPALAALLGIGAAWAADTWRPQRAGLVRLATLAVGLAITIFYGERLLYGRPGAWWVAAAGALGAIALAAVARLRAARTGLSAPTLSIGVLALTLLAALAIPLSTDVTAIRNHVTDAGYVGALPTEEQRLVSGYLRAHQGRARYETAAESATQIGSLIVQDARPILILTTYGARVFTSVSELRQLISHGAVRYAFLNSNCGRHASSLNAACSAPAQWIRANGTDVSRQAGLSRGKILWRLPGVGA